MGQIPEGRKPLGVDWFSKWLRPTKEKVDTIREMTDEERQRSLERSKVNGKSSSDSGQ